VTAKLYNSAQSDTLGVVIIMLCFFNYVICGVSFSSEKLIKCQRLLGSKHSGNFIIMRHTGNTFQQCTVKLGENSLGYL